MLSDKTSAAVGEDKRFMRSALREAVIGGQRKEVPVGAVVVWDGRIIARMHNQSQQLRDCTAHAEMLAITAVQEFLRGRYLDDCTLYTTLEPCVMCAGAMFWSQLGRLVYGATDHRYGFSAHDALLHPKTLVTSGVLAHEATTQLRRYFEALRLR